MMSTAERIRVLIADDHPVVREALSSIIDHQPDMIVAARATTGAEAAGYCAALRPDVVLMDLSMPEMDGVEATRVIHKTCPETRIVVLTVYAGDATISLAIQAGAFAYVLKSAPMEELLAAIRTVHSGKRYIPTGVAATLAEGMGSPALTSREEQVLQLIARGMSNKQIAAELGLSISTAKAHVNGLLHKLGVKDRTEALVVALRRGVVRIE